MLISLALLPMCSWEMKNLRNNFCGAINHRYPICNDTVNTNANITELMTIEGRVYLEASRTGKLRTQQLFRKCMMNKHALLSHICPLKYWNYFSKTKNLKLAILSYQVIPHRQGMPSHSEKQEQIRVKRLS